MTELFNTMNILYVVTGGVFFAGLGVTMIAFALSYISQKTAMWIEVRKIVQHRNHLIEQVAALKTQIETLESMPDNQDASRVVSPTEIGVQSVPIAP